MQIELSPGTEVIINFSNCNSKIKVLFSKDGDLIQVSSDLPDSSGRKGMLFEENRTLGVESDEEYKARILMAMPAGQTRSEEDLEGAVGREVDEIGEKYGVIRKA